MAPANASFPELDQLLPTYRADKRVQQAAHHNVGVWRNIVGACELTRRYPLDFDPRNEYWFLTERRVLVAYFARFFADRCSPPGALRKLAFQTFAHFDRARQEGRFGEPVPIEHYPGGWGAFRKQFLAVVRDLPDLAEFQELRARWPQLKESSIAAHLETFLEGMPEEGDPVAEIPIRQVEPAFFKRLPWFPYLGLARLEDLLPRQKFFASFYTLFASTNAYTVGGGMAFAPVLQNNPTGRLLDYVEQWTEGRSPAETRFLVLGRGADGDREDRSHYMPVVELFGFLNLHRQPFYNRATAHVYDRFTERDDPDVFAKMARVGEHVRAFLSTRPELREELVRELETVLGRIPIELGVTMEGIRGKVAERYPQDANALADREIARELHEAALGVARTRTREELAQLFLHILLDAVIWTSSGEATVSSPAEESVREPEPSVRSDRSLRLPRTLVPRANDALAYLKAGFHVVLAGPPGTGKTTVAQFTAHAWNHDLEEVVSSIPLHAAPTTTVATSAWVPFHTIGGIIPDENGRFRVQRGIFVEPGEKSEEWSLRGECIVLDEMNRADLDRCIGELYPLLTRSVDEVAPAGIPGVRRIRLHPKFRIVATVNDTTLDDIVFPISEGLARRFVRIELLGATLEEVTEFLTAHGNEGRPERLRIATELVKEFYRACKDEGRLLETEIGEHLPFGVGYFGLLGRWVSGELRMSAEFNERELRDQALVMLRTTLAAATGDEAFQRAFGALE